MYEIKINTLPETNRLLKEFPVDFRNGLVKGVRDAMLFAEGEAKKSFGKQGHLKIGTGHLRRSIRSSVKDRYRQIVGSLYSDVIYAAIHEYGGVIRAKHSPYLKFSVQGRWVQVKSVTIPARPYLEPAVEDNLDKMESIITDRIAAEVN